MNKRFIAVAICMKLLLFSGYRDLYAQFCKVIPVSHNDTWGLAERYTQKIILSPQYYLLKPLGNGYFQAIDSTEDIIIIDSTGKKTLRLPEDIVLFTNDGLMRYGNKGKHLWYHVSGRKIKHDPKQVLSAANCYEGLQMYTGTSGKEGFLDIYGKIIVKAIYDKVYAYENGYGTVLKNNKWGMVNRKGQLVIPVVHEGVKAIGYHRFILLKNNKQALAGIKGKLYSGYEYDFISNFYEGYSFVKKDEQYWYIDTLGKNPFGKIFARVSSFENGMAIAHDGKNDLLINTKGEVVYSVPAHQQVKGAVGGLFFEVYDKEKSSNLIIDAKGRELYNGMAEFPHQYFSGCTVVEKDGKYGVINQAGAVVIPVQYSSILYSKEANAWYVREGNREFYIDEKGNPYIKK